jgi:hypothetical protein
MIPSAPQNQGNAQLMDQELAAHLHTPNETTLAFNTQSGTQHNIDTDFTSVSHRSAAAQANASASLLNTAGTQPPTNPQEPTLTTPHSQQDDTL